MAGTWTSQNKLIPAAYINVATNAPLSITPGERGTVVILQELTAGTKKALYRVTATESELEEPVAASDRKLAELALQGAKTVLIYNMPGAHKDTDVQDALNALKLVDFDVLVYPYAGSTTSGSTAKQKIATWIKAMQDEDGVNVTAVLGNYVADSDYVINVAQGVVLSGGTVLTADETAVWVAGITAGAAINRSNTGRAFIGAVDVTPKMSKSDIEAGIAAGKFLLAVDRAQNVRVVADINSLTTVTPQKGELMKQNRSVRTAYGIRADIASVWESSVKGQMDNTDDGRARFKGMLVEYFNGLQALGAIQNFEPDQIEVRAGTSINAVLVVCSIQLVGAMELAYITVNLT